VMAFGLYGIGAKSSSADLYLRQSPYDAGMFEQEPSPGAAPNFTSELKDLGTPALVSIGDPIDVPSIPESNKRLEKNREISFIDFIRVTLEKDTYAVACWLIAGFIEVILFLFIQLENHSFDRWS